MLRALQPQTVGQQGFQLRRDKPHLGRKLHSLLAKIQKVRAELRVKKNDGFGPHGPVLGSSEGQNVHSQVARGLAQAESQAGGGVGDAGAVHMQKHAAVVGKAGQDLNLIRLIDSAHFGGLRDRNHPRLNMMLISCAVAGPANRFHRELAVRGRNRDQLRTYEFFRRPAFILIEMRFAPANHGLEGAGERGQTENVGRGAIEHRKDADAGAKVLLESA